MSSNTKTKKPKPLISRVLTVALAAVLLAALAINGYGAYDLFWRGIESSVIEKVSDEKKEENNKKKEIQKQQEQQLKEEEEERVKGERPFSPLMMCSLQEANEEAEAAGAEPVNTKVTDEYSAKQVLGSLSYELGIKDVESEYGYERTAQNKDYNFYIMKQYHNGIEIAGADLTMQVDKSTGDVINISGQHYDIPEDLNTEMLIGYDEANQRAIDHIKKEYGVQDGEFSYDNRGQKIFGLESGFVSCYDIQFRIGPLTVIVAVSTTDGSIQHVFDKSIRSAMEATQLQGQLGPQRIAVNREYETQSALEDTDRNIHVHVADREALKSTTYDDIEKIPLYRWDPMDKTVSPDPSAVDTLSNIQKVYDFYTVVLGRSGIDGSFGPVDAYVGITDVVVSSDRTDNFGNNAAMGGSTSMYIGTRSPHEYSAELDVIGHESFHGVISSYNHIYYDKDNENSYMDAINEGLADIFGELTVDFTANAQLDGVTNDTENESNWNIVGRNFFDPVLDNCNDFEKNVTDCHVGGTLVNGLFYRMMTKPVKTNFNMNVLANLYYSIVPALNNNTDFKELKKLLINQALKWNAETYSDSPKDDHIVFDDQVETMFDAFDFFNYPVIAKNRVKQGGKLIVYDKDEDPYDNYNIKFARAADKSQVIYEEDIDKEEFEIPSEIPNGYYNVTFTDLADKKNKYSCGILINDNASDQKVAAYPDKLEIYTQFNSEAREVVLVIDNSGSMDGSPIQQARSSGVNFVNTVLKSSPNTGISLITYNSSFSTVIRNSSNRSQLVSSIQAIRSGGGTDTYDALNEAYSLLKTSEVDKRLIVLLSDGLPNEGPNDNGDYYAPIYRLMDEIKADGIIVYSLGFFHNLAGYDLNSGQDLMSNIATEGYDYVVDNADEAEGAVSDLELVFNDFAEMVNGKQYINVRVACPVDVTVTYNGETLTSDQKHPITRTAFGSLSYEKVIDEETGQDTGDPVKILRLETGSEYEICINGTGKGKMNYTISYPDEKGEYTDVREFKKIPITKETVIATSTKQDSGKVELKVDTDSDGKFDLNYEAAENEKGEETSGGSTMKVIIILANCLAGCAIVAYIVFALIRKRKENPPAPKQAPAAAPTVCVCGAPLEPGMKFCRSCGTPVPAAAAPSGPMCPNCSAPLVPGMKFCTSCGAPAPEAEPPVKTPREPAAKVSKAGIIVKTAIIALCICFTSIAAGFYYSPAVTVFKQLRSGQPESAQRLYDNSVKSGSFSDDLLSTLVKNQIGKAASAFEDGDYSEAEYRTLLEGAKALGIESVTEKAKEELKNLNERSDSTDSQAAETDDGSAAEASSSAEEDA